MMTITTHNMSVAESGEIIEDEEGEGHFVLDENLIVDNGELAVGIVMRDGVVVDTRHHELLCDGSDPWDDSVLMSIYRKSVKSHKFRKGRGGPKEISSSEPLVGAPGPWIASIVQKFSAGKAQMPIEQQTPDSTSSGAPASRKRQRPHIDNSDGINDSSDVASFSMADFQSTEASTMAPPVTHFSLLDAAFNDMVSAWYHSGYATARYQTLRELLGVGRGDDAEKKRRN